MSELNYNILNEYIRIYTSEGLIAAVQWFDEQVDQGGWVRNNEGTILPDDSAHNGQVGCPCRDCASYREETGYDAYDGNARNSQWPKNKYVSKRNDKFPTDEPLCNSGDRQKDAGQKEPELEDEKRGQASGDDESNATVYYISKILKQANSYDRRDALKDFERALGCAKKERFTKSRLDFFSTLIRILYIFGESKRNEVRSSFECIEFRVTNAYDKRWKCDWATNNEFFDFNKKFERDNIYATAVYSGVRDWAKRTIAEKEEQHYERFAAEYQNDEKFKTWQNLQFENFLKQAEEPVVVLERGKGSHSSITIEANQPSTIFNGKIEKHKDDSSDAGSSSSSVTSLSKSVGKYVKISNTKQRNKRVKRRHI